MSLSFACELREGDGLEAAPETPDVTLIEGGGNVDVVCMALGGASVVFVTEA